MKDKLRASIIGVTGYTGHELVKLLVRHPNVTCTHLVTRMEPQPIFSELFPQMRGLCDMQCSAMDAERLCVESDVIFFALPHTVTMGVMPQFIGKGVKVIDLSADYRLNDANLYKDAYKTEHTDSSHLNAFVYGLPEINRAAIAQADYVANPGCFPTGVQIALKPFLKGGLISADEIIIDSKTGVSGGGRKPKPAFHYPEINENMLAYKVADHQHEPEIEQELSKVAGEPVDVVFVPHLVPMTRGIYNTIYTKLRTDISEKALHRVLTDAFADSLFVRIMPLGETPQIKNVANTNFCDIGMKKKGSHLILMSCIDNLIKGASGQAVQNMNLMFGIDEHAGLM